MEFVVLLFFFGLSAGVVGKIRGSSFAIWFMVGFVLPIFGTVAAAVVRNDRAVPKRGCPECGKVLPIHDQVCSRCGADLDYPDVEPEVPQGTLF